jgi:SpoVK/Ycf46/Vps4 family AAA+-type ATPase
VGARGLTPKSGRAVDLERAEQVREEIDELAGLEDVKDEVDTLMNTALVDAIITERGGEPKPGTMHMIFEGPSGTGKTTVARKIGELYNALGLLPTSNFKEVRRADLIGTYAGETGPKVRQMFYGDKSKNIAPGVGGVIFIDEAYSLVTGENDSYGAEAIAELLVLMENHRDDTVVILAGYDDGKQNIGNLMQANPGLPNRFPRTITFPSYDNKTRFDIAVKDFKDRGLVFGDAKMKKRVSTVLSSAIKETGDGNARDVRNLVDAIVAAQKNRIGRRNRFEGYSPSDRELVTITPDDIIAGTERYVAGRR